MRGGLRLVPSLHLRPLLWLTQLLQKAHRLSSEATVLTLTQGVGSIKSKEGLQCEDPEDSQGLHPSISLIHPKSLRVASSELEDAEAGPQAEKVS